MANGSVDVSVTAHFRARYRQFPPKSRQRISTFINEVMKNGFANLEGRNKFSDDVSPDDPDFIAKVQFVYEHCLWHYHVGIHDYEMDKPYGDRTSMFVLHYKRHNPASISVNHLSPHPPFTLPTLEMFT
ncbi:hypothetical protein ACOVH1_003369 [Klebsiella pneumoniae]|uniref:hypothetical protein n=1 Tax=Enterobacteriaceae TaxID=543 RepID=UPI00108325B5|nr:MULTISPECIES: hypothetical protein [Enterobacteriaceae]HBU8663429.1 hypothetical protein [Klebsiella oxytoca]HDU4942145.1 hypothetical protein [Klebsiella pneumoniae subsp. ozaenae]MBV5155188.1 hypothetical protein [Klebsiella pneumoniae]MCA5476524.1 hypothetical protein [Klebsiella pneumoniae]MCA5481609.1 hypothetical protein [Klebsiella pneumoniae]